MKKLFWPLYAALLLAGASACSDDDASGDPAGTVMLNMRDEANGKTVLEDSGIYIDRAMNFVAGNSCDLFPLGKSGSLGGVTVKSFENPVSQVAVQKGHAYAACRPASFMRFPSGKLALPIGNSKVNYLKIHVVSELTQEGKPIGAVVKYAFEKPRTHGLPAFGQTVLEIDLNEYHGLGEEVALTLPTDDCEYVFDGGDEHILCEKRGRKLYFALQSWYPGEYTLYLRVRESYTKTLVRVVQP